MRIPSLRLSALIASLLFVAACTSGASPAGSGGPGPSVGPGASGSPAPSGSGGASAMTPGQLRLVIVAQLGPRWWCDPDFYPLAHDDEGALAIQHFADMQAEGDVFGAVVASLGLTGTTTFTDAQKLAIYQAWKPAASFPFESIGNGRYRFDYLAQPLAGATSGTRTTGTIDDTGHINVDQQGPAPEPNCPICLARGTPIDGPDGPIAVDRLRLGDRIWTLDTGGRRLIGTVIALGSTPAPPGHEVVRLVLADGRRLTASPGHPLADGRHVGDLRVGDLVDGSRVVSAERLAYTGGETFDLAVSGETGIYLAGGVPLRSTITP